MSSSHDIAKSLIDFSDNSQQSHLDMCVLTATLVDHYLDQKRKKGSLRSSYSNSKLSGQERLFEQLDHTNPRKMQEVFGMSRSAFRLLIEELGLEDSKKGVLKEEKLAMFLSMCRWGQSLRQGQTESQRSRDTESKAIHEVLHAILRKSGFYKKYVKMPDAMSKPHPSLDHPKYEQFKGCIGAIDGTHIPMSLIAKGADEDLDLDMRNFRDRKNGISFNTLVACDFDLMFIFVAGGFEGCSNDAGMWSKCNGGSLKVPKGRWLLADAGFPLCDELVAPFRGVRYHLQEFRKKTGRDTESEKDLVENAKELFNLRHSSRRMIIEKVFGVLKARYRVFRQPPEYAIATQAQFLPALCAVHNFLRVHNDRGIEDRLADDASKFLREREYLDLISLYPGGSGGADGRFKPGEDDGTGNVLGGLDRPNTGAAALRLRRARCDELRMNMAEAMWNAYVWYHTNHPQGRFRNRQGIR